MNAWYPSFFGYVILISLTRLLVIHGAMFDVMQCFFFFFATIFTHHIYPAEVMKMKELFYRSKGKKKNDLTTAPDHERFRYPKWG